MMDWFNSREPRERVLLGVLAALLLVFAAWFALTRESGPDGVTVLAEAQTDRELFLRAAPRLGAGPASGDKAEFSRGALFEASRRRGVALSRVQPQNDGGLSVWVDGVETAALYGLIDDLMRAYAVDMQTAVISTAPSGGLNAQFTLLPI